MICKLFIQVVDSKKLLWIQDEVLYILFPNGIFILQFAERTPTSLRCHTKFCLKGRLEN